MSSDLDAIIQTTLNNDPALAQQAKALLGRMMAEADLVLRHGTPQMKAQLISRGLSSILSHAATAKQVDEFADMRAAIESIRSHVFADVPVIARPDAPDSPTDTPRA